MVAGARKLACRATSQRPVGGIAPKERTGPKGAGLPAREEMPDQVGHDAGDGPAGRTGAFCRIYS